MKILVTGYMGLIGRHLARDLKQKGHEVHGCDLRTGMDCRETFSQNEVQYDLVFHCADDFVPVRRLAMAADLFDWVDRTRPGKVVYFSTDLVYPAGLQLEPGRLSEVDVRGEVADNWPLLAAEQLAVDRGAHVLRPFQVYGEGGRGVFHQIMEMVREQKDPFRVPGCGRVLDFIHVDDVVATTLASLDFDLLGPMNVCTGEPTAVDELAIKMFEVVGWEPSRLLCDPKDAVFFRCGSVDVMNEIRPATISLEEGIRRSFK